MSAPAALLFAGRLPAIMHVTDSLIFSRFPLGQATDLARVGSLTQGPRLGAFFPLGQALRVHALRIQMMSRTSVMLLVHARMISEVVAIMSMVHQGMSDMSITVDRPSKSGMYALRGNSMRMQVHAREKLTSGWHVLRLVSDNVSVLHGRALRSVHHAALRAISSEVSDIPVHLSMARLGLLVIDAMLGRLRTSGHDGDALRGLLMRSHVRRDIGMSSGRDMLHPVSTTWYALHDQTVSNRRHAISAVDNGPRMVRLGMIRNHRKIIASVGMLR